MLKKNIVKGLIAANFGAFINRGIQFITKIILAKFLLPQEFGIVALALIFINFLGLINGFGVESALIQKKDKIKNLFGSAFVLTNLFSIFLFVLVISLSKLISVFYGVPELDGVIKILAILLIIQPLKIIPSSILIIEFKFFKINLLEIATNLLYLTISIFLIIFNLSYWNLIIGYLCSTIFHTFLLWMFTPFEFRSLFFFDCTKIKELLNYGKYIVGANFISFLITQGDDLFVGKFLGLSALGFYTLAFTISDLTTSNISHSIMSVAFPVYSHFKKNAILLRKAYLKNNGLLLFLLLPIFLCIFIFGNEIIYFVLGQKWMPMVLAMQILCLNGLFKAIHINSSIFLVSIEKLKLNQIILVLELIALALIIYPLTSLFNIAGTALAVLLTRFLASFLAAQAVANKINQSLLHIFFAVCPLLFVTACTSLIMLLLKIFIPARSLIVLICYILLGLVIYLIFNTLFNQDFILNLRFMILEFFKKSD